MRKNSKNLYTYTEEIRKYKNIQQNLKLIQQGAKGSFFIILLVFTSCAKDKK